MAKPNFEDYIGRQVKASNGQIMTIIDYHNAHDITVQFEDGTIVTKKSLSNFIRGRIANPNYKVSHLGEYIESKYGMKLTIICYRSAGDMDVRFEDGYTVEHVSYSQFLNDRILNKNLASTPSQSRIVKLKNERLGQTSLAKNGQKMTLIEYKSSSDITVQFEDGTIVTGKDYPSFLQGNIRNPIKFSRAKENNPKWRSRLGEERISSCGQIMRIIDYRDSTDIDVQFEDGTIVKNKQYNNFVTGKIMNPTVSNIVTAQVGMTNTNTVGLKMKIIEIIPGGKIKVQFEDGVIKETSLSTFKSGQIRSGSDFEKNIILSKLLNEHIGEKWKDSNNEEVTIIERVIKNDKPSQSYIVQWKDGRTLQTSYNTIKGGKFSKRNASKVGLISKTKSGETMKIIEYRNSHDLDVQFEDGTIVKNRGLSDFYRGYIKKEQNINKEFRETCEKLGIDYEKALAFRRRNKVTDTETILHFRPDCYINILGELVTP